MTAIFETERLRARPWTADDAEAGLAIYGDPEVTRFIAAGGTVSSVEMMQGIIEIYNGRDFGPGLGVWAVERKDDGNVVGSALLVPLEGKGPEIEVGWHFARAAWGNGFATEAGAATIAYGFATVGLKRIIAVVYPENERSLRVCERLGMKRLARRPLYGHELECFEIEPPRAPS